MQATDQSALLDDVELTARRIFSLIAGDLAQVEAEFERQAHSNVQVISYLGEYLRASGGKRVRPALTILANYAAGGDGSSYNSIRMATVMEFLHTATLVHDDIIDNAETRRNRPTVNALYGNETAVLMGDWLYMSAFETSLAERSLPILDILTRVTRKMTEGELLQLTTLGRSDISEEQYLDIIERKTAYLFSACCEVGAILAGANEDQRTALADYGRNLGMAFQLTDDLLDFTSSDDALGKGVGVDLIGGKVTLPLIDLMSYDASYRDRVEAVMREGTYVKLTREELRSALEGSGSLERARSRADAFASDATRNIDGLPSSKYAESLKSLPSYVLERDR
ncbi:MAG TPA: polyprenyl synthetase family protein [Pyrinomonadaceae bacterium]|nr:polyprenyl synthetase family protein [Pyrinomonadaceae bacterium]